MLALHPKIDSLGANTEKHGGLADSPRMFIIGIEAGVGAVHNHKCVGRPLSLRIMQDGLYRENYETANRKREDASGLWNGGRKRRHRDSAGLNFARF